MKQTNTTQQRQVSLAARAKNSGHPAALLWLTGLSAAGKTTIAYALEAALFAAGALVTSLDGDHVRSGLNSDLGFSPADRSENIRRVGEVAKLMMGSGHIVIGSFISPYRKDRARVRDLVGEREFIEIFVDCPLEVCERRDPKGHYQRARAGLITDYTGISAPYEPPTSPALALNTATLSVAESVVLILELLDKRDIFHS